MSLDVYLYAAESETTKHRCECGHEHDRTERILVYSANITHNLGRMADAAGIYGACWRPDEHGLRYARDLVPLLRAGLADMRARPDHFKALQADNGWGLYVDFVPWIERYLAACEEHPGAVVEVWR